MDLGIFGHRRYTKSLVRGVFSTQTMKGDDARHYASLRVIEAEDMSPVLFYNLGII
jgi:hypothetical protein